MDRESGFDARRWSVCISDSHTSTRAELTFMWSSWCFRLRLLGLHCSFLKPIERTNINLLWKIFFVTLQHLIPIRLMGVSRIYFWSGRVCIDSARYFCLSPETQFFFGNFNSSVLRCQKFTPDRAVMHFLPFKNSLSLSSVHCLELQYLWSLSIGHILGYA